VHFYSSFWRFLRLNSAAVNCFRAGDVAPRRDVACCARARAAPLLPRRPGPPSRVPRPPFPRTRVHRGRLEVLPLFPRATRRPTGERPTDRRTVRCSPCQALLPRPARAPRRAPLVPWSLACTWVAYKQGRHFSPSRPTSLPRAVGPPGTSPAQAALPALSPAAQQPTALARSRRGSGDRVQPHRPPSLAGRRAAAANTAGDRCTSRRRPPLLPNPNQTGP
jgi:hypothetical protein